MGRKRKDDVASDASPGEEVSAGMANLFQKFNQSTTDNNSGELNIGSTGEEAIGIPLRPLSCRWLFGVDCFLLGKFIQIVGPPESQKTALANEIGRWHIFNQVPIAPFDAKQHLGWYFYHLAESGRDQPDFRQSIIGHSCTQAVPRYGPDPRSPEIYEACEDWQTGLTSTIKAMEDAEDARGRPLPAGWLPYPVAQCVDSITALNTRANRDKTWESGHAMASYGDVARLCTTYFQTYFAKNAPWPSTLIGINHYKPKADPRTGAISHNVPGGEHLKFGSHTTILMKRIKEIERKTKNVYGRQIAIRTLKNSASANNHVDFVVELLWNPPRHNEGIPQHTWWDWDAATFTLLMSFEGRQASAIDDIVKIESIDKTHQTATCKSLGLTKASWSEIGAAISGDPKVSDALSDLLGIVRRTPFRMGVPYYQQQKEAREASRKSVATVES